MRNCGVKVKEYFPTEKIRPRSRLLHSALWQGYSMVRNIDKDRQHSSSRQTPTSWLKFLPVFSKSIRFYWYYSVGWWFYLGVPWQVLWASRYYLNLERYWPGVQPTHRLNALENTLCSAYPKRKPISLIENCSFSRKYIACSFLTWSSRCWYVVPSFFNRSWRFLGLTARFRAMTSISGFSPFIRFIISKVTFSLQGPYL